MNRRTRDLPPLPGISGIVRDMRYNEIGRQGLGLVIMAVYSVLADPQPMLFVVGAVLALSGMSVRLYASGYIIKNQKLATDGPYSLVRHPLYTGNLLMVIGFTFISGLWWAILLSALFWWFYYPTAIEYEDRKLHGIFGEDWEQWSRTVPAVIPVSLKLRAADSWSFKTSLSQNAEPLIVIYTLGLLYYVSLQLT
jgi:uncharacterized membrane protein